MGRIQMISVIVPVYNLQDCISYCLDSLINQTYRDTEIIVINDGSTDQSTKVCEAYCRKDSRIRQITQDNAGVSVARNTGLDNARGEYVAFVDGDDIVAPFYLERLYSMMNEHMLAICMHERIDDYSYEFINSKDSYVELSASVCAERLISGSFPVGVWGGLFERRRIGELRFRVGIRNNEDKLFLYSYLLNNEDGHVSFTNQRMYGYYVRQGSATNSSWNGNKDIVTIADIIHELTVRDHPEWASISRANCVNARLGELKSIIMSGDETPQAKSIYKEIRQEILSRPMPNELNIVQKIEFQALKIGDPVYKLLVWTYNRLISSEWRDKRNERRIRQDIEFKCNK